MDVLVVGSGFAGCVAARELADSGRKIVVIDRRAHLAGNAHDQLDRHGVLIHTYGPHIFHTNSERVVRWLSRFTDWHFYEHRVLAQVEGRRYPVPINRTTINGLYGLALDEVGIAEYLEKVRVPRVAIRTSEDVVLSSVGSDLCEKFFRGYTRKQWGIDLSELSAGVAARVPTRTNDDDRYFGDTYQFMPSDGYTRMFERMLDHPGIEVRLNTDYFAIRGGIEPRHVIYTGPIDAYFDYCYGRLPYRSLRFEHEHLPNCARYQEVGTVNFPNDHAYTRITEFRHLTGQLHGGTSIVKEYPQGEGEPYYPIPRLENEELYQRYKSLADDQGNATFIGRLAQYRYYNMDQVVAASIKAVENIVG